MNHFSPKHVASQRIALIGILLLLTLIFGACQLSLSGVGEAEPIVVTIAEPTAEAVEEAAPEPTAEAVEEPTEEPTPEPTLEPTVEPTSEPTATSLPEPTEAPTESPTEEPIIEPVEATEEPTVAPEPAASGGPTVRIARPNINLRLGPGTNFQIVGNAVEGETFAVTGRNGAGDWYEITTADGGTAWTFAGIVELSGDAASIAVVESVVEAGPASEPAAEAPASDAPAASTEAAPAPAPAANLSGLSGRLLYSVANMDAERWELWEYNFGSGSTSKIADWRTEIDVSRDGAQIVYFAWPEDEGDAGIWIMDRDYSNRRLVLPGGAYPSFSPGGDRLVLNGGQDMYIVNTDGNGLRPLTRGEYPAWNPVNDQVVHRACVGGDCGLWTIDANSNDPGARARITTGGSDGQPSWSPNGSRIAYISQDDGNFEIYAINADASGKQRLTENAASDGLPVWSPDGQWIAFRSDRGGSWGIYAMRADGSDVRKILDADVLPLWFFEKMVWY